MGPRLGSAGDFILLTADPYSSQVRPTDPEGSLPPFREETMGALYRDSSAGREALCALPASVLAASVPITDYGLEWPRVLRRTGLRTLGPLLAAGTRPRSPTYLCRFRSIVRLEARADGSRLLRVRQLDGMATTKGNGGSSAPIPSALNIGVAYPPSLQAIIPSSSSLRLRPALPLLLLRRGRQLERDYPSFRRSHRRRSRSHGFRLRTP